MRMSVVDWKEMLDEALEFLGCPDDGVSQLEWVRTHEVEWVVRMWNYRETMEVWLDSGFTEAVVG